MSAGKVEVRPLGSWYGIKPGETVEVDAELAAALIEQGAALAAEGSEK